MISIRLHFYEFIKNACTKKIIYTAERPFNIIACGEIRGNGKTSRLPNLMKGISEIREKENIISFREKINQSNEIA